jgi:ribosomal protein S18 acetylase RimI-like enzyme
VACQGLHRCDVTRWPKRDGWVMHLIVARTEHVEAVLALRDAAAEWLLDKGVQQWTPGELPRRVVARRIEAGETYVLPDSHGRIRATVTIDFADEHTWGVRGADGRAGYVHTLVVHPDVAGSELGRRIMRWAEGFIADAGRVLCRLDCAESNDALRNWYRQLGYREVGRREYGTAWFSVVLFERALDKLPRRHLQER